MPFWVYRAMNVLTTLLFLLLDFALNLLAFVCWFHMLLFLRFKTFILIGLPGRLLIGLPCRLLIGLFFTLGRFCHGVIAGLQLGARVALGNECFQRHEVGTRHWFVTIVYLWHIPLLAKFVDGCRTALQS